MGMRRSYRLNLVPFIFESISGSPQRTVGTRFSAGAEEGITCFMQRDVFTMPEHLRLNQLLAHLPFQFQRIPFAGGFRATGIGFLIVIELNNPVFASFVYAQRLSP